MSAPRADSAEERERLAKMCDALEKSMLRDSDSHARDGFYKHADDCDRHAADWRAIASYLRQPEESAGWRTMDSAPMDQTAVLLLTAHPVAQVVGWRRGRHWTTSWNDDPLPKITHWQPLPSIPGDSK